jgi:hypothetical protein
MGSVTDALCHACIDYYYSGADIFNPKWFEALLKKVASLKRKQEQARIEVTKAWKQQTLEQTLGVQGET